TVSIRECVFEQNLTFDSRSPTTDRLGDHIQVFDSRWAVKRCRDLSGQRMVTKCRKYFRIIFDEIPNCICRGKLARIELREQHNGRLKRIERTAGGEREGEFICARGNLAGVFPSPIICSPLLTLGDLRFRRLRRWNRMSILGAASASLHSQYGDKCRNEQRSLFHFLLPPDQK